MNFDMKINDTSALMKYRFSSRFKSSINDVCLKSSLNFKMAEWNSLKIGLEVNNYKFNNAAVIEDIEKGNETRSPSLVAWYVEDKLKFGNLIIRPGVRFSDYSYTKKAYPEPRLNGVLTLPGDFEIRAGWGVYYQYIISMNTSEYEMSQMLDYYYPLRKLQPSRSVHYIFGCGKKISSALSLTVDAYFKDISRIYTFDLTQSEIEAFSFSDKLQKGSGKAYGLEAILKGQYNRFSGWLSMGLSRSTRKYPQYNKGEEFLSDYDKLFTFKGVCNFQVTQRLSYSASWQINSGHPITVAKTQQSYFYYEPVTGGLKWSPQYVTDKKNNARLPMYIQLDVGFKKQIREGFGAKLMKWLHADESYLTGTIENVTFFRRNVEYYFYVPQLNYYFPFGMNYFPNVYIGYVIKF
jgi:outer membrane receptor protein involved in Fe transport